MENKIVLFKVVNSFEYYLRRFCAYLIDSAIISIAYLIFRSILFNYLSILITFGLVFFYFIYYESSEFQGTIGKRILKLKVVDYEFYSIKGSVAARRLLFKIGSFLVPALILSILLYFTEMSSPLFNIIAGLISLFIPVYVFFSSKDFSFFHDSKTRTYVINSKDFITTEKYLNEVLKKFQKANESISADKMFNKPFSEVLIEFSKLRNYLSAEGRVSFTYYHKDIVDLLNEYFPDKNSGLFVVDFFTKYLDMDIIKSLKASYKNYEDMDRAFQPLYKAEIVQDKYPYDPV